MPGPYFGSSPRGLGVPPEDGRPWQQDTHPTPRSHYDPASYSSREQPFSNQGRWNPFGNSSDYYQRNPELAPGAGVGDRPDHPSHYGKGPVAYQRPDSSIREEICEILTYDSHIDASEIEVSVEDGEVTLDGTVTDRSQKKRAQGLADSISGIRDVHNRITVRR